MGEIVRRTTTPAKATKKTAAKKTPAKKAAGKKAAAKKMFGTKPSAGKAAANKAAPKAPAKKAASKKAVKKTAAKKIPPHKADAHRPHKKARKSHAATERDATTAGAAQRRPGTTTRPAMGVPQLPAPPLDPLSVLGLTEPLDPTALRRAWRSFAARHHPDRGGYAVTFARGQHAYDVLKHRLAAHD